MNMCECGECLATGRTDEGTGTKKDPEDYSVILNGERGCHWPHDLCMCFRINKFPSQQEVRERVWSLGVGRVLLALQKECARRVRQINWKLYDKLWNGFVDGPGSVLQVTHIELKLLYRPRLVMNIAARSMLHKEQTK